MPILDKMFRCNPILMWLNTKGYLLEAIFLGVPFAAKHMKGKLDREKSVGKEVGDTVAKEALLTGFIRANQKHPETVTDREIQGLSLHMIFSGSDTT